MGDILTMPDTETWRATLTRLQVPVRYANFVPFNLELRPKLRGWQGSPWSVVLLGPVGCGKTWQAVRLFGALYGETVEGEWNHPKRYPMFVDASALIDRMKQEMDEPELGHISADLRRAPALLLDDYGAERATDFAQEQMSLLLRSRYNDCRPTIITSNAAHLGEFEPRLASRFADGIVDILSGGDRRLS